MNDYLCLYGINDDISERRGSKVQHRTSKLRSCCLIYREMCFWLCEYKRTTRSVCGDTYLTRQHDTYHMARPGTWHTHPHTRVPKILVSSVVCEVHRRIRIGTAWTNLYCLSSYDGCTLADRLQADYFKNEWLMVRCSDEPWAVCNAATTIHFIKCGGDVPIWVSAVRVCVIDAIDVTLRSRQISVCVSAILSVGSRLSVVRLCESQSICNTFN